jgi:solute carrier family 34 (sodium-dependent phosphate cotransporter)
MGLAVSGGGLETKRAKPVFLLHLAAILALLALFLFALDLLAYSCKTVGADLLNGLVVATANPLIGLCIGLLATAMAQSSSLVTSMLVAVAASGQISPAHVVPIVIGANIGTTITSTIVSFGYITTKKEFKRAIAAGTCHDFFNILTACLLFPLEYSTHFLSQLSSLTADWLLRAGGTQVFSLFGLLDLPFHSLTQAVLGWFGDWGWLGILVAIGLLFASIQGAVQLLKAILFDNSVHKMEQYVFGSPLRSLGLGMGITAVLQSSSLTTSAMIPLVARKQVTLWQAFPFILGANVGTTVTALLASFAQGSAPALNIAIAHFLFNAIGVAIFFPLPVLRRIPLRLAEVLGTWSGRNRWIALLYMVVTFFLLPFFLIFMAS